MTRKYYFAIAVTLIMLLVGSLAACKKKDPTPQPTDSAKLSTPLVQLADNNIYWDTIKNADYYEIYLNNKLTKVTLDPFYSFSFTINGRYSFTVVAKSLDKEHQSSDCSNAVTVSVSRKTLAEPKICIEGNVVSWQAIDGATSYGVYVNDERIEKPQFDIQNNVFFWKCQVVEGGEHTIAVQSESNNAEYETESNLSNSVAFTVSTQKKWNANTILADWATFGGVETHDEGICIECIYYSSSGLVNYCLVDGYKPYFRIDFCQTSHYTQGADSQIVVYANGTVVKALGSTQDYIVVNGETTAIYNLSKYVGKVVEIKIESIQGPHACIQKMSLSTKDNVSPFVDWNNTNFLDEWDCEGKVTLHTEGICLEHEGILPQISNTIFVPEQRPFFTISLRKFVRTGVQDKDPKVCVYINGTLQKAIDVEADFVTATGDTYQKFAYDLRNFVGQAVNVKIVSTQGEHACLNRIYMSSKGNYSLATSWDKAFIEEEWAFIGKVEVHIEGICLENDGEIAALENTVLLNAQTPNFTISFRKFVRSDVQDKDPHIQVYVNDNLVKANGVSTDYVTATGDDYQMFTYNLSNFVGTPATIKIVNVEGEHACFDTLYFAE